MLANIEYCYIMATPQFTCGTLALHLSINDYLVIVTCGHSGYCYAGSYIISLYLIKCSNKPENRNLCAAACL